MRGQVTGTQARRRGRGLVRGRRPGASESFTYTARLRVRHRRADRRRRGLHRDLAGREDRRAGLPGLLRDALAANGISPTSTTSTRRAARRRTPRRARALRRGGLVHGRRRRHPRAGRGRRHASRLANDEMLRDARLHERGRQAAVHGQVRRRPVRAVGYEFDPVATRRAIAGDATARRRCPAAARTTSSSTTSGAYLYNDGAGHDPRRASRSRRRHRLTRSTALDWALERRRQRRQPGPQRLVRHHQRPAAGRRVPAVRQRVPARSTTGRAGRSSRTRATTTCTRRSPTSPTSG